MNRSRLTVLVTLFLMLFGVAAESREQLEFTVREGTWLSLDMSPDGRTVVFELLGDVYALPASGGRATALLSGPALPVAAALFSRRHSARVRE